MVHVRMAEVDSFILPKKFKGVLFFYMNDIAKKIIFVGILEPNLRFYIYLEFISVE